ncbi:MAG: right-handed parallel beta-helix repeat-containing protein [Gemmataceae bacterium]
MRTVLALALGALAGPGLAAEPVRTAGELVAAVKAAKDGDTVELAAGRFELDATLELRGGMTLKGAGMDRTTLTHAAKWKPSTATLPDPETRLDGLDTDAYLLRIRRDTSGVTVSDMTLHGPRLHGAIFSLAHTGLHLHHLRVRDFLYSGVRTMGMKKARIHDCEFVDAGGRWDRGKPGVKGGLTGGAIFACWMGDCEIADNRFRRVNPAPEREFYGIKVRQGVRCRVHHNTIETGFSMEFPFENDEDNEIDHNYLWYAISLPKHAGGVVPRSGKTFHIHHNYFRHSYAIEFVRNGVEIDHNLFDFETGDDGGNLISGFGSADARGPAKFHNNLVSNPGRGVIWINEVFNNLEVRNNHVRARTTKTPRKEGLFGFNPKCDFKTIAIRDNRIECEGEPRPLLRCKESYGSVVENNELVNVADADRLKNPKAGRAVGPEKPLKFACGVKGEFTVDGWKAGPTK